MRQDDMVARVHREADLETWQDAKRTTRAVLSTLGQRLAACPNRTVAYQLPASLAMELTEHEPPREFDAVEFLERVVGLGGAPDVPEAARRVRVVGGVLRDTMRAQDLEAALDGVPDDVRSLLGAGTAGDVDVSTSPERPAD